MYLQCGRLYVKVSVVWLHLRIVFLSYRICLERERLALKKNFLVRICFFFVTYLRCYDCWMFENVPTVAEECIVQHYSGKDPSFSVLLKQSLSSDS
jgi:hypothetical protein